MKKMFIGFISLVCLSLALVLAEEPNDHPTIYLALDGTGSLSKPSPINPSLSQLQVLQSLLPELYGSFRTWDETTTVKLFVVCHKPILAMQTKTNRSAMPEVMHGIEDINSNCTQKGTRIDQTLEAIHTLQTGTNPYAVIFLTDGISETEAGLNLEDAFKQLGSLSEKPPTLFAMIGVNEEYVFDWLKESQSVFTDNSEIVIGSARDIASTLKHIKEVLR